MPEYRGDSVSVRMIVADDLSSITEVPWNCQGEKALNNRVLAEKCFDLEGTAKSLREVPVPSEQNGIPTSLRFLGRDQDMPFFLIMAHRESSNHEGTDHHSPDNGLPIPQPPVQAFCMQLELGHDAFPNQPCLSCKDRKPMDLKADVYLNGELTSSHHVPARDRPGFHKPKMCQLITGRRIERLMERAWIFGQSDGAERGEYLAKKLGKHGLDKSKILTVGAPITSASHRWNTINAALFAESERLGRTEDGEPTVLGQYLSDLTNVDMPSSLDLCNDQMLKFGVIDVVITCGFGAKDDATRGYIDKPTALRSLELKLPGHSVPGIRTVSGRYVATSAPMRPEKTTTVSSFNVAQPKLEARGSPHTQVPPNFDGSSEALSKPKTRARRPLSPVDGEFVLTKRRKGGRVSRQTAPREHHQNSSLGVSSSHDSSGKDGIEGGALSKNEPVTEEKGRITRGRTMSPSLEKVKRESHFRARQETADPSTSSNHDGMNDNPESTSKTDLIYNRKMDKIGYTTSPTMSQELDLIFIRAEAEAKADSPGNVRRVTRGSRRVSEQQDQIKPEPEADPTPARPCTPEQQDTSKLATPGPMEGVQSTVATPLPAANSFASQVTTPTSEQVPSPIGSEYVDPVPKRGRGRPRGSTTKPKPRSDSPSTAGPRSTAKPRNRLPPELVGKPYQTTSIWKPSSLNDDCVIGYYMDGVRQIDARRPGWFQESGIVLGVRYIITG